MKTLFKPIDNDGCPFMPRVVKIRDNVPGAVRIDRQSCWGNPFVLRVDGDRDEVCDYFEEYAKWRLTIQSDWLDPLRGKDLACWCSPQRCHGNTLLRLANK
tara:strand:- start:5577 stop:5879 length:303 start_codon:yes stop_codon:yes gene_type:complete